MGSAAARPLLVMLVADSLHAGRLRMQRHCETLARSFHARCNPLTETIRVDRAMRFQG